MELSRERRRSKKRVLPRAIFSAVRGLSSGTGRYRSSHEGIVMASARRRNI
jgi:hypothetical protein